MNFRLTDLAADEIEALRADGVEVTPQDVLTIQQLSLEATGETDGGSGSLARGTPFEVSGEWLYPLTLAGHAFCEENDPYTRTDREKLYVLAFAMRYGHDYARIYRRGREAVREAARWAKNLRCTVDELVAVMDRVIGDAPPAVEEHGGPDSAEDARRVRLSLIAAAVAGGSAEEWETQCTIDSVCKVIEAAFNQHLADGTAAVGDSRVEGLRRLALYSEEVRNRNGGNQP